MPNNTIPKEIKDIIDEKYEDYDEYDRLKLTEISEWGYSLAAEQLAEKDKEISDLKQQLKALDSRLNKALVDGMRKKF